MRKTVLFGASGLGIAVLCVVALEARAKPKSPAVTADIHIVYRLDDGRQFTHRGRFYRSRTGQIREDSSLGALITDVNAGTVTLLVADRREAHVFKIPPRTRPQIKDVGAGPFEQGTYDGHPIKKSRTRTPDGKEHELWLATDVGLPVYTRIQNPGMTTMKSLVNVSVVDPDAALFQVPPDYTQVKHDKPVDQLGGAGADLPMPRAGGLRR